MEKEILEEKFIEGQEIVAMKTIGSWFDHNCIQLLDSKRKIYRMNVDELNKIICSLRFKIVPKRVHEYLEISKVYEDEGYDYEPTPEDESRD
jgi:hypothetical protein